MSHLRCETLAGAPWGRSKKKPKTKSIIKVFTTLTVIFFLFPGKRNKKKEEREEFFFCNSFWESLS